MTGELARQRDRYLRHLAIERGRSANTLDAYRRDLDGLLAGLEADADAAALTERAISDHLSAVQRSGRATASRTRLISSIRGFARFLVDEGVLAADPAARITAPKAPRRLPKALRLDQVEALLAATEGEEPVALRDRALLELLYATGARVSEVTALDVDDLLGDDGALDLVRLTGKGGKQRIVPVGSFARTAVDAYLVRSRPVLSTRGAGTPALFLGARGARLSRQSVWLVLRAAAARAHVDAPLSPHSLRHSFATHLLQGGADVRVVQELLGHADVGTTQLYTLVTADALRDAYTTAHPRAR